MKFDDAVEAIRTLTDLRRIAGAVTTLRIALPPLSLKLVGLTVVIFLAAVACGEASLPGSPTPKITQAEAFLIAYADSLMPPQVAERAQVSASLEGDEWAVTFAGVNATNTELPWPSMSLGPRRVFSTLVVRVDAISGEIVGREALSFRTQGQLSGTVEGLDPGDQVTLMLRKSAREEDIENGQLLYEFSTGNGPWEAGDVGLPEGSYFLVPQAEGYLSISEASQFDVPEEGIVWRGSRMDFELFRPEDAVERFGYQLCDVKPTPSARPPGAPPPPLPKPLEPGATEGVCAAMHTGYSYGPGFGLKGQVSGLPEDASATAHIYLLPKEEGFCYYQARFGECVTPEEELSPLDSLEGQETLEEVATIPVGNGRWGLMDASLAGDRYLVTLDAPDHTVRPPGYTVVVLQAMLPFTRLVDGVDFAVE